MLVLTRKVHQQIRIGDQITITIVRVKGQSVRVGIEAPRAVRVLRGELGPMCPLSGSERTREAVESTAGTRETREHHQAVVAAAEEDGTAPGLAAGGRRRRAVLHARGVPGFIGLPGRGDHLSCRSAGALGRNRW